MDIDILIESLESLKKDGAKHVFINQDVTDNNEIVQSDIESIGFDYTGHIKKVILETKLFKYNFINEEKIRVK